MGGGGGDATPMICIDCGYIYKGDFSKENFFTYKCPTCGVGKNRFKKAPQSQGNYYGGMAAAKRANKAAAAKKRKGSARAKLREQAMQNMKDKDAGKGGGGWFGR
eukprot:PRCOL_00007085-RA